VGEGYHARAGESHAEPTAIAMAGNRARGATAYVTLEPCAPNPAKRTPPCAPLLIEAGIARLVIGARDLNPGVNGKGLRRLRRAGVEVNFAEGRAAEAAHRLTRPFNTAMRLGRPFVTLKAGMTLDGRVATSRGESRWITSPRQRAAARRLRRLFDGVLVGVETALHDDPILLSVPRTRRPFTRIVLDSKLRLKPESRLVATARTHPLIVICARNGAPSSRRRRLEGKGATVIVVAGAGGRANLGEAMRALFRRGVTSLMVEGGSEVMGSFVRAALFDVVVLFRAPLLLGGRSSLSVVGGDDPERLDEAIPLRRAIPSTSTTLRYGLGRTAGLEVEVYEPRRFRTSR